MNPGFETELLLVDNIQTYLKTLGWFDVSVQEQTEAFPRNVMPVLLLGKLDFALELLFNYMWSPWRITVLSPNADLSAMIWDLSKRDRNLQYDELRVMPDKEYSGWSLRGCKTRQDVENLVLDNVIKLGGNHEEIESFGSGENRRKDWR